MSPVNLDEPMMRKRINKLLEKKIANGEQDKSK